MSIITTLKASAPQVASFLLEIGAIKLQPDNPFQWASGWNSPIYCDNRLSLSFPSIRSNITEFLTTAIKEKYPEAEGISGVATAGIPQGALVAEKLNLPFSYVRSKAKSHGMTNLIEGKVEKGQKLVVIEDLVSTGGSSLKACKDLKSAGAEVIGMAAIFTYGFDLATKNFDDENVNLVCLSDYGALIEEALRTGYIKSEDLSSLKEWRNNPGEWMK